MKFIKDVVSLRLNGLGASVYERENDGKIVVIADKLGSEIKQSSKVFANIDDYQEWVDSFDQRNDAGKLGAILNEIVPDASFNDSFTGEPL